MGTGGYLESEVSISRKKLDDGFHGSCLLGLLIVLISDSIWGTVCDLEQTIKAYSISCFICKMGYQAFLGKLGTDPFR